MAWTTSELGIDGYTFAAGSLVVESAKSLLPVVDEIATRLGLRVAGTKRKPTTETMAVGSERIGLYRPWVDNADEGWTRLLLDRYEFRYNTISDADIRAGNLRRRYRAIILPSAPSDQLMFGNPPGGLPSEYVGGLGDKGIAALKQFVESGGTLVCLDQACALAIAQLTLPVRDVAHQASQSDAKPRLTSMSAVRSMSVILA